MLPIQDRFFLIKSKNVARALQPKNPSHTVVTPFRVSETRNKSFKLGFSIVLFRIHRTVFYLPPIMGPPSSPFILKLFPIQNFF